MSTGTSAAAQSELEDTLSITSRSLDQSMKFYNEAETETFFSDYSSSSTKFGINATEGSGVKFTGYAQAGDTVYFDYLIASNDYIPYNDFAFVQLKTGTALGGDSEVSSSLQSLGSIGYDVDNFGSKSGTFSYTLTAADFNNSNETLLTDFSPKILFDVNGDGVMSLDGSDEVIDLYTADNLSEDGDPFIDFNDKVLDLNSDGTITILDALVDTDGDGSLTADDADDAGSLPKLYLKLII